MWPFNRKRRESLAQFAKFIPPEVIEEILAHPEEEWPPARKLFIGHIVIQARDDDLPDLERLIPKIIDGVRQHQGLIEQHTLSLVIAFFGAPAPTSVNPATLCQEAANALVENLGSEIKIVYGSGEALVGNWGHPQFSIYGARFPAFSQRLQKLCEMSYGESAEMNF